MDKPAGISVHGVYEKSVGLLELMQTFRKDKCLKLCHRLDKDTSGLLTISKKRSFLLNMQKQLKNGEVNKKYLAICLLKSSSIKIPAEICKPLLRTYDRDGNRVVTVSKKGKYALTKLYEIERFLHQDFGLISLIECIPATGRTHQIRRTSLHWVCLFWEIKNTLSKFRTRRLQKECIYTPEIELPDIWYG